MLMQVRVSWYERVNYGNIGFKSEVATSEGLLHCASDTTETEMDEIVDAAASGDDPDAQ